MVINSGVSGCVIRKNSFPIIEPNEKILDSHEEIKDQHEELYHYIDKILLREHFFILQ